MATINTVMITKTHIASVIEATRSPLGTARSSASVAPTISGNNPSAIAKPARQDCRRSLTTASSRLGEGPADMRASTALLGQRFAGVRPRVSTHSERRDHTRVNQFPAPLPIDAKSSGLRSRLAQKLGRSGSPGSDSVADTGLLCVARATTKLAEDQVASRVEGCYANFEADAIRWIPLTSGAALSSLA